MINLRQFSATKLLDFGIVFDDPKEGEHFAEFIRKELNFRIDERIIAVVPEEKLSEFKTLKDNEETAKWFNQNCPQFQQIRKEEYVKMAWELLTNRERLNGVTIPQNKAFPKTSLTCLDLHPVVLDFLHQYNIWTIENALESECISDLEKLYPDRIFKLKYMILDYLFPSSKEIKTEKTALLSKAIDSVYKKNEDKSPEEILDSLHRYILDEASHFRNGELSEDEFYINTYALQFVPKLLKLKNNARIIRACANGNELYNSFVIWKSGQTVISKPWMSEFIEQSGRIEETITWFYKICDDLCVPIMQYMDLSCFSGSDKRFDYPRVIKEVTDKKECFILAEKCLDFDQLKNDHSPYGKMCTFHFDHGTYANVLVIGSDSDIYRCEGRIDGYMVKDGLIEIKIIDGKEWFCFGYKNIPRLQGMMQTAYHPVPHPKWRDYDDAVLRKGFQFESEYKQLRIPFILNSDTKEEN